MSRLKPQPTMQRQVLWNIYPHQVVAHDDWAVKEFGGFALKFGVGVAGTVRNQVSQDEEFYAGAGGVFTRFGGGGMIADEPAFV